MRGLSDSFIKELQAGILNPILNYVRKDATLSLEIRNNYINIYYRGGSLVKIKEDTSFGYYNTYFDTNYISSKSLEFSSSNRLDKKEDVENWIQNIPLIKREMDFYFSKNNINPELFILRI